MDWVYKRIFREKKEILSRKDVNNYKSNYRRLKYCNICEHVWEIIESGSIAKYLHLPKYGLNQKVCKMCK